MLPFSSNVSPDASQTISYNKKSALPKCQVLGVCRNEPTHLYNPLGQGTVIIILIFIENGRAKWHGPGL